LPTPLLYLRNIIDILFFFFFFFIISSQSAECSGYREVADPPGLQLHLFPFQRQTLGWMIDQEAADLNRRFWEERAWPGEASANGNGAGAGAGGNPYYYFPAAGELRLEKPPRVSGGLLSSEMGLGKTISLLALILEDRRLKYPHRQTHWRDGALVASDATLIVVPVTLLAQW
jgi:SWI/SNF-related matrix-associated actin-dependent regulator of chromatin subfamily A3